MHYNQGARVSFVRSHERMAFWKSARENYPSLPINTLRQYAP